MGYLTTITIYNDALGSFEKDPKAFGEAIFKGIKEAQFQHKKVPVGLMGYCNYISIQPSRHADDETIYLHTGNGVINMNPWNKDFEELYKFNPEIAKNYVKKLKFFAKECETKIKELNGVK